MRMQKWTMAAAATIAGVLVVAGCASKHGSTGGNTSSAGAPVKVARAYSKTGLLGAVRSGVHRRLKPDSRLRDERDGQGRRPPDPGRLRRRHRQPGHRDHAREADIGQGIQDPRWYDLLRHRAPARAAGSAEQDPLRLRPRRQRRDHRREQVHLPLGAPNLPGRRHRWHVRRRPAGKKVLVFAQDTAFGQGNAAAVKAVLRRQGRDVSSVLVPENATDFTPFAKQVMDDAPTWCSSPGPARPHAPCGRRSTSRGVFDHEPVVTGLADAATFGAYGAAHRQDQLPVPLLRGGRRQQGQHSDGRRDQEGGRRRPTCSHRTDSSRRR